MGVAGCGKSAIGAALATRLGATYVDGDDLHPPENIARMSRGEPLTDDDRWPWLTLVGRRLAAPDGVLIIGCSALKRRYRDHIRNEAGRPSPSSTSPARRSSSPPAWARAPATSCP